MKKLRCGIYTRKSSEEGLEQNFNSLDAQREACAAYILSQAGEGWVGLKEIYDDGGFSGGSMDRPALKRLMAEVEAKRIDVIVVYKVDRLTRSLADFARIVEVLDRQAGAAAGADDRGAVRHGHFLRRRGHHAGDFGAVGRGRPGSGCAGAASLDHPVDPARAHRPVRGAALRHRWHRPRVRPDHPGVVHRAGGVGCAAHPRQPGCVGGAQPVVRGAVLRSATLGGLRGAGRGGAVRDRRLGPLRRYGPFRPVSHPHRLVRLRHAGAGGQLLRPGRHAAGATPGHQQPLLSHGSRLGAAVVEHDIAPGGGPLPFTQWDTNPHVKLGQLGAEPPLPEIAAELQKSLHSFAEKVMRPIGTELDRLSADAVVDRASRYWEIRRAYAELGINMETLASFSAEEMPHVFAILFEELGWGDSGLAISAGAGLLPHYMAAKFGNGFVARTYPESLIGSWGITEPDRGSDSIDPGGHAAHAAGKATFGARSIFDHAISQIGDATN